MSHTETETESILSSIVIDQDLHPTHHGIHASSSSTTNINNTNNASRPSMNNRMSLPSILRRLLTPVSLDVDSTITQMVYLLHSPKKVYKLTSWRNQTKNQYSRDDPSFVAILCWFIVVSSIATYIAVDQLSGDSSSIAVTTQKLQQNPLVGAILCACWSLTLFIVSGIVVSTWCWHITNTRYRVRHSHSVEQEVEWLYAFDIHCNSFFPLLVILGPGQFLLLPVLLSLGFLPALLANALYGLALGNYCYITFLGYLYLPFLSKTHVTSLLYPIAIVVIIMVLFTILKINSASLFLSLVLHFSS